LRPQKKTTEQIFVVRQKLENFYAHDIDYLLLFIDFKKAFFSINQKEVVIGIGVMQGDGLSATLFILVLHKALKNLEQCNTILNRLTQICGYADDILVIARSLPALEALCV
jgi:hypothetical protein